MALQIIITELEQADNFRERELLHLHTNIAPSFNRAE
jgi:hypothetical protein